MGVRETHLRIHDLEMTVRTELTGSVAKLEREHTKRVKDAIISVRARHNHAVEGLPLAKARSTAKASIRRWYLDRGSEFTRRPAKVKFQEEIPAHLLEYHEHIA